MTNDTPTETSAHESAARFREEVQREHRTLLYETRKSLHDLHTRLSSIEMVLKTTTEDLHALKEIEESHYQLEKSVLAIQHWADLQKAALEAAANLHDATRGARFVLTAIFAISTGILAVAGVLQLFTGTWQKLWQ